jgi:hypothetical protein
MVLLCAHGVDVARSAPEVYRATHELHLARLYEVVLKIGVPYVEAVGFAGHTRTIGVPIKHVKGVGDVVLPPKKRFKAPAYS